MKHITAGNVVQSLYKDVTLYTLSKKKYLFTARTISPGNVMHGIPTLLLRLLKKMEYYIFRKKNLNDM